jgi:hypothetical protein
MVLPTNVTVLPCYIQSVCDNNLSLHYLQLSLHYTLSYLFTL